MGTTTTPAEAAQTELPGELLYEYTAKITQVVEYGVSMQTLTSGEGPPPAEGARVDVHFEGPITGSKLSGTVQAIDYLYFRADGASNSTSSARSPRRTARASRWPPPA